MDTSNQMKNSLFLIQGGLQPDPKVRLTSQSVMLAREKPLCGCVARSVEASQADWYHAPEIVRDCEICRGTGHGFECWNCDMPFSGGAYKLSVREDREPDRVRSLLYCGDCWADAVAHHLTRTAP